jgi:hypothetical protein
MAAHAQTEFPVKPHAVPTQANADALTRRRPCLTAPDIVESSLVLTIRRKRPGSKCRELCISPKVLPTNPGGINIRATKRCGKQRCRETSHCARRHRHSPTLPIFDRWPPWLRLLPCSGNLIHPIDFAEFVQKLWIAVIEANDFCELRAVSPFVFYDLAPNLDFAEQQSRGANEI